MTTGLPFLETTLEGRVSECNPRDIWGGNILEGEVLDIALDILLGELAANETLDIVDGVEGVRGGLVLGGVSDEALVLGKGDVRGGNTVSCACQRAAMERVDAGVIPWSLTRISTLPFCITPTQLEGG